MQAARQIRRHRARRWWLGRRVIASELSPYRSRHRFSQGIEAPEAAAGASSFGPAERLLGAKRRAARCGDLLVLLLAEHAADAAADGAEEPDRDEDPRLGVGVLLRVDVPLGLDAADNAGDEVVHLAQVVA